MSTLALILAVSPLVIAVYAYAAYPLLLLLIGRRPQHRLSSAEPLVTVVVPAYNEEGQIRGAIEALLAQDYPAQRRQVLILSDGSTDRTDDIVREYASQGIELLRMPVRGGKTAAENASVAHIRGDVVVNTDASIRMHPGAVKRLVQAFADPTVGVASSRDVSVLAANTHANAAESGYVGYEMWVRSLETRVGGIVGASGSGYAIRAELHRIPVRADLSRDFSAALTARKHGYRAVSVSDAVCFVPRTATLRSEYRRKVRTISRGMETLLFNRRLLDPLNYGLFSWQLISHKVCRWLVPLALIPSAIGLSLLARDHVWAVVVVGIGFLGLGVAAIGAMWPTDKPMPRALSLVTFGVAANVAVIHAAWRVIHGHEDHLWEPTRRPLGTAEQPRSSS